MGTDHRPLVGVFNKDIHNLQNPCLQRLRERLAPYSFTFSWFPGKTNLIADALSRAPVFAAEEAADIHLDTAVSCLLSTKDKSLSLIYDCVDEDYRNLVSDVLNGTSKSIYSRSLKSSAGDLSVDHDLVLLDSKRIVIPQPAIKAILHCLHFSHNGFFKTYEYARQMYYWPGMSNDIRQLISACIQCSKLLPSQPQNPMSTAPPSSYLGPLMQQVGLDLFDLGGKSYLICVDQWSGFPVYARLTSMTVESVIKQCESWFNTLGWPRTIRSDGGPQFTRKFTEFCSSNNIHHALAEAGVKNVKFLLKKCQETGENPERALYEWRNCPRADGYSPAQLMFGRSQATQLPALSGHYRPISFSAAAAAKDAVFSSVKRCMIDKSKFFLH